ncbi:Gfo/Idh/MocA family protein [Alicyclobacillus mengziensis]
MMLKVLVIGAGTMGSVHATAYADMTQAELVGVVDIRLSAAEAVAAKLQTKAFKSFEAALASEDIDVVDICVPTYLHRRYVEQVAGAGKHVVCEKPMARNLEDAQAMIEACEGAGVQLFIAQVVRFFPEYRRAHDLVIKGAIGEVGNARAFRGGVFPTAWNDWYANVELSGSLIVDLMIHDFDFLRWCFGDVERVYAKSQLGRELNRTDHALVSLRFKNGIIAHVEGSWAYPSGFRTELEITGTKGMITHDSAATAAIHKQLRSSGGQNGGKEGSSVAVPESPLRKSPYQLELEHFMDCLRTGTDPLVTAEDAYKALEISFCALKSARTGEPVNVGEPMASGKVVPASSGAGASAVTVASTSTATGTQASTATSISTPSTATGKGE